MEKYVTFIKLKKKSQFTEFSKSPEMKHVTGPHAYYDLHKHNWAVIELKCEFTMEKKKKWLRKS